jgi:DNA-binding transcriptional LysR family regulator
MINFYQRPILSNLKRLLNMDIEQLRTLLEVNRTRHFRVAADALFVTQSAVSARIRKLEEELGVSLFERQTRNIQVTPQGNRLLHHAEMIMAIWRRARQDVALADEAGLQLALGGLFSLWDILLQDWIAGLRRQIPGLALVAESHDHDFLVRRLLDGALDLIFVYEPPQLEEVLIKEVATVPLIMVSSEPGLSAEQALRSDYVMVDWGYSFALQHARQFPAAPPPAQRMNQARLAMQFILQAGGSAYLAAQTVLEQLQTGTLHQVTDAAPIVRRAHAVYPRRSSNHDLIQVALGHI